MELESRAMICLRYYPQSHLFSRTKEWDITWGSMEQEGNGQMCTSFSFPFMMLKPFHQGITVHGQNTQENKRNPFSDQLKSTQKLLCFPSLHVQTHHMALVSSSCS